MSLLMLAAMVMAPLSAVAATGPALEVIPSKTTVELGEVFTVTLKMSGNTGFVGMEGGLVFDREALSFQKTQDALGEERDWVFGTHFLLEDMKATDFFPDTGKFALVNLQDVTANGDFFTVSLRAEKAGSVDIGVEINGWMTADAQGDPVYLVEKGTTYATTVTVVDTAQETPEPPPAVTAITLSQLPQKTAYLVGEKLDTAGLLLTVTYADGTTATVDTGYGVAGFNSTQPGEKEITVTYGGQTATFTVTVAQPVLSDIQISLVADKPAVKPGDVVNITLYVENNPGWNGMQLQFRPSAGLTPTQTVDILGEPADYAASWKYMMGGPSAKDFNIQTGIYAATNTTPITRTGEYFTVAFRVDDILAEDAALRVDMEMAELFLKGEEGRTDLVPRGTVYTVELPLWDESMELQNVAVDRMPTKTAYYVGETLDTTGLELALTYGDGSTKTVTEGFEVTAPDMATAGEKEVTVTYEGKTATFLVTVKTPTVSLSELPEMLLTVETATLIATVDPVDAAVVWTSSDEAVATVEAGVITPLAAGEVTVTATITVAGIDYTASRDLRVLLLGDVDQNGAVTVNDALMALQYVTNKIEFTAEDILVADVDGSGGVTVTDALLSLQLVTNKIDKFPYPAV